MNSNGIEREISKLIPDSGLFSNSKKSLDMNFSIELNSDKDSRKTTGKVASPKNGKDRLPTMDNESRGGLDFDKVLASNHTKKLTSTPENLRHIVTEGNSQLPVYTTQKRSNFSNIFRRGSKDKENRNSSALSLSKASLSSNNSKGSKPVLRARSPTVENLQDDEPIGKQRIHSMSLIEFLANTDPKDAAKSSKPPPRVTDIQSSNSERGSLEIGITNLLGSYGKPISNSRNSTTSKSVRTNSLPLSSSLTPPDFETFSGYASSKHYSRKTNILTDGSTQTSLDNLDIPNIKKQIGIQAEFGTKNAYTYTDLVAVDAESQTKILMIDQSTFTEFISKSCTTQTTLDTNLDQETIFNFQADKFSSQILETASLEVLKTVVDAFTQCEQERIEDAQIDGETPFNDLLMSENSKLHQEITQLKIALATEQGKVEQMRILKEAAEARFEQLERIANRKLAQNLDVKRK